HHLLLVSARQEICLLADAVAADAQGFDTLLRGLDLPAKGANAEARLFANRGQDDIVVNRGIEMQAHGARAFRHQAQSVAAGTSRRADIDGLSVDPYFAARNAGAAAKNRFENFGAAGAQKAAD